jgi:hypothetical protein
VDVRGWRKSLDEVAAFYFTSLGDSYAARTDRPANVGVIGVALFQRKREPVAAAPEMTQPMPYEKDMDSRARNSTGEPASPRAEAPAKAQAAPLATGHGRREESRVRWVDFERAGDEPAETVAIYYDSYRNLVAQGVLQVPPSPRDPNPFPTVFAPDPWR